MKSKFNLLFESIIDALKEAEVTYKLPKDIVLKHIADFIGLTVEELTNEFGDIEVKVADKDDIISFVNDGFVNDVTKAEAEKEAGHMLIVDLEGLTLDEDTYNQLIDSEIYSDILHDLHENGNIDITTVFMK
jgi:hypothetical protein